MRSSVDMRWALQCPQLRLKVFLSALGCLVACGLHAQEGRGIEELRARAEQAYLSGNLSGALPDFEKLVSLFPEDGCLHGRLAGCALTEPGRMTLARRHLRIANKKGCTDVDLEFHRARLAQLEYDFERARDLYAAYLAVAGKKARFKEAAERGARMSASVKWSPSEAVGLEVLDRISADPKAAFRFFRPETPGLRLVNVPAALRSKADLKTDPERMAFHDGDTVLVYSSLGKKGQSGWDLFRISLSGGDYAKQERLSDQVNTEFDERDAYLSPGGVLYFSSDRPGGLGGYDIYAVGWAQGQPSGEVYRLPFPINSVNDDAFFIPEPDGGAWFASNRAAAQGRVHAYRVALSETPFVAGTVAWVEEEVESANLTMRVYENGELRSERNLSDLESNHMYLSENVEGTTFRVVLEDDQGQIVSEAFGNVETPWELQKQGAGWAMVERAEQDWAMLADLQKSVPVGRSIESDGEASAEELQGGAVGETVNAALTDSKGNWGAWVTRRMEVDSGDVPHVEAGESSAVQISADVEETSDADAVGLGLNAPEEEDGLPSLEEIETEDLSSDSILKEAAKPDSESQADADVEPVLELEPVSFEGAKVEADMAEDVAVSSAEGVAEGTGKGTEEAPANVSAESRDFDVEDRPGKGWSADLEEAPDEDQLAEMLASDAASVVAIWEEKLGQILVLESSFLDRPSMAEAGALFDLMEAVEDWSPERDLVQPQVQDGADFEEIREMLEAWSYAVQSASKASLAKLAGDAAMAPRRQKLALRELEESAGVDVLSMMHKWSDWRDARRGVQGVAPELGNWTIEEGDAVMEQWENGLLAGAEVWSRKARSGWRGEWLDLQNNEFQRNQEVWREVREELLNEREQDLLVAEAEVADAEAAAAEAAAAELAAAEAAAAEAAAAELAAAEAAAAEAAAAEAAAAEAAAAEAAAAEAAAAEAAAAEAAAAELAAAEAAAAEAAAAEVAAAEAAAAAAAAEAAAAEVAAAELAAAELAAAELAAAELAAAAEAAKDDEPRNTAVYAPIPIDPFGDNATSTLVGFVFPEIALSGDLSAERGQGQIEQEVLETWKASLSSSSRVTKIWERFVKGPGKEGVPMVSAAEEMNSMSLQMAEAYLDLRQVMLSELDDVASQAKGDALKAVEEFNLFFQQSQRKEPGARELELNHLLEMARMSEERQSTLSNGVDFDLLSSEGRYLHQEQEERAAIESAMAWRQLEQEWSDVQLELQVEIESEPTGDEDMANAMSDSLLASERREEVAQSVNLSLSEITPMDENGDLVVGAAFPFAGETTEPEARAWGVLLAEARIEWENNEDAALTWIPEDVELVRTWSNWVALRAKNEGGELKGAALSEWDKALFFAERELRSAWERLDLNGFESRHSSTLDVAKADEAAQPIGLNVVPVEEEKVAIEGREEGAVTSGVTAVNVSRASRYGVVLPEAEVLGSGGARHAGVAIRPIGRVAMEKSILNRTPMDSVPEEQAAEAFASGSGAPLLEGVEYKVQIGAFRNALPAALFAAFDPMWAQVSASGITRYMAGSFDAYDPAVFARDAIRDLGYTDAFVVRFVDGERVKGARPPAEELAMERSDLPQNLEGENRQLDESVLSSGAMGSMPGGGGVPSAMPSRAEEIPTWANVEGRVFSVQVGAFRGVPDGVALEKLGTLTRENAGTDGWLRLFSGRFGTEAEAALHRDALRIDGRKDAFVVVYINGRRIPLLEASTTAVGGLPDMGKDNAPENATAAATDSVRNESSVSPTSAARWKVELGEYASTIPVRLANAILDAPLNWEIRSVREDGRTRYVTQLAASFEEASSWLKMAREMGFSEARLFELDQAEE